MSYICISISCHRMFIKSWFLLCTYLISTMNVVYWTHQPGPTFEGNREVCTPSTRTHSLGNPSYTACPAWWYIRLKLKKFYSLNQFVLLHLLSKFLAFLAFIAFKGLKRLKKAKKKLLPNDLELSNLARNQIKKISPAKFFSTFVTLVLHGLWPWWPFFEKNLVFEVQESLY